MTISRNVLSALLLLIAASIVGVSVYKANEAREESRARRNRMTVVRELLADDSQGLVVLSPDGRIIEWSPGATEIFGWTLSEVMGSYPDFLIPPKLWELHKAKIEARQFGKTDPHKVSSVECWAMTKSGKLVQVHVVVSSFRDHVGYNHIAIISKVEDYKRLPTMPKPTEIGDMPVPHPQVIEVAPGVYSPFSE